MGDRALLVMAKAPQAGLVKTRMTRGAGALDPTTAAELQHACVADILSRHVHGVTRRDLWTHGDPFHPLWDDAFAAGWAIHRQPGDDLGANMRAAFGAVPAGVPAVVIGTDSPDLPDALFAEAFQALAGHDLVMGPSHDGGYYLLGMSDPAGLVVLDGVAWGTDRVAAQTLARARDAYLSVHVLPAWHDLDEVADLWRLRLHSGSTVGGRVPHVAPRTTALLERLGIGPHGETG